MVGRFVEVCKRKGLKVNAGKSKVLVLGYGRKDWNVRFAIGPCVGI